MSGSRYQLLLRKRLTAAVSAIQSGYQLEFKFAGGSKPASFQTERFSGAAINFTKADAAFCAALPVVAAAP